MSSDVVVERQGPVLFLTFDRPHRLNALRRADIDEVRRRLEAADDVRALVFAGAGERAFSAGVDVDEFLALDPETAEDFIRALRDMLLAVRTFPGVTVCAVDGHCLGGAFELALACDLRVVTTRSTFGLPEIKLGIPSVVDAALLQQHVGLGVAKEMILTGDRWPASDPHMAALSTDLVEPAELDVAVAELLARTDHTRTALAAQKRLFETWQNTGLIEGAEVSVREFAAVFAASETRATLDRYRAALSSRRSDPHRP